MYMGVDNPITINNNTSRYTFLRMRNGIISEGNAKGKYIVRVLKGASDTISLVKKVGKSEVIIGESNIRIKRLPDPVATVAGVKEGAIKKSVLVAAPFVVAKYENFDFDLKINVYSFTIIVNVAGEFKSISFVGNAFSFDQKMMIEKCRNNTRVIFEGIKCRLPDGTTRTLPSVTLRVQT